MHIRMPSVQVGTDGLQSAQDAAPMVTGPAEALWVGFAAFIVIFLLALILIIRRRVILPARHKRQKSMVFEPAGEDAEITFDDDGEDHRAAARKTADRDETKSKEGIGDDQSSYWEDMQRQAGRLPPAPKKTSPFSKIFSEKGGLQDDDRHREDPVMEDHHQSERDDYAQDHRRGFETGDLDFADAIHQGEDYDAAEAERRLLEEEAAYEDRARSDYERAEAERYAAEEAERARYEADERERALSEREEAAREAEFERRKAEAALEQRMQSVSAMQRKLAERADRLKSDTELVQRRLGVSLDEKFQALSNEMNARLEEHAKLQTADEDHSGAMEAAAELANFVRDEVARLRASTEDALGKLSERIDKIQAPQGESNKLAQELARLNGLLAERAAAASAGRIQLADLVRSALPADRYTFSKKLSSGRTADCLISMPGLSGPIAVDARYPVEEFDAYARAGKEAEPKARTAYQQAVLKHIVGIAENLISPGETADFAILFVPSENIFNDLHANFADLVQDSYRAKIWVLSPTSLMASLHMMSAVGSAVRAGRNAVKENGVIKEIDKLRERVDHLEREKKKASASAKKAQGESLTPEEEAFEKLQEKEALADEGSNGDADRPPFPLR